MSRRRFVIIGAGVVGAALADELASRGERDVIVLDKGPLFDTGGSSSHAPGLISRTSPSRFLAETADYTIDKFDRLSTEEGPALHKVGTLEVAYNEDRLQELWRRHNVARSFGWHGRMIDPDEVLGLWPIINPEGLLGAYTTTDEGLGVALRAVAAQARRAQSNGAIFRGNVEVVGFAIHSDRVTGVKVRGGETIPADVVVCSAGVWGPRLAHMVDLTLPMLPMEHQYVVTSRVAGLEANEDNWATMPILRHHDTGIYFRDHGDRVGIGSFHHKGLPVRTGDIDDHPRNLDGSLAFAFTEEDWADAWTLVVEFLPALRATRLERSFNGIFGFTPDGYPLVGEHPGLAGFWVAESVWVTHSAGVARMVAEMLVNGGSSTDSSPADLTRFDEAELEPSFFEARCDDQYRDVYVAHHPVEPHTSARDIRFSAFAERERELGAVFFDAATWERPQWYESNSTLVQGVAVPARDVWSSRHWSPTAVGEHLAVRERAGLFDMSPLTRIQVSGPGAETFLSRMIAGRVDRPTGSVVYSVMLDDRAGVLSDVTVARFEDERFVVGANGPRDVAWLRRHTPDDGSVVVADITKAHACAGLWGPAAREILAPLTDADLSNETFPYLSARAIAVGGVRVDATRISYAGELGWELTVEAADGSTLWDALWSSGAEHGLIAAGRAALGTLRIEKGYRAWGSDVTPEHGPQESGLGFTVRTDGGDFLGRAGLAARPPPERRLRCLVVDDDQVAMGGEPLSAGGETVGYVTSAGYGASVGASIAYAWLDTRVAVDDPLEIAYFDRMLPAHIAREPLFDRAGERLRA